MYKNIILPLIFSLCVTFSVPVMAAKGDIVKIGDEFPSFFLKDINGNDFFLSEYIGEKATKNYKGIIFSFCASYCEPCKKEIPELEKLLGKYEESGLGIYLIALEKKEQAQELIDETKTNLTVLVDRYLVLQKLLGFTGIPFTVLIDNNGKVRLINSAFSEKNADEIMEGFEHAVMDVLGIDSSDAAQ